jgi:hypothetical protein
MELFKKFKERGAPAIGLPDEVNDWRSDNWAGSLRAQAKDVARAVTKAGRGTTVLHSELDLTVIRASGLIVPLGLGSLRVVTDTGVGFIVDAFQNLVELENMKYHGVGTGGAAEAVGNTALTTELTTQYNPDNTRATGTTIEGATANIYRTVATNNFDATVAITEHGIFSQAAVGGGVLLDRSLFSAINLVSGDGLQTQYDLTFTSGG